MIDIIDRVDRCNICGRFWDDDGLIQLSSYGIYKINEFICDFCINIEVKHE